MAGKAQLHEAILERAELNEAILLGAQLNKANLQWAELNKASLHEAELNEALLGGAELNKADLRVAQLNKADLLPAAYSAAKSDTMSNQGQRPRQVPRVRGLDCASSPLTKSGLAESLFSRAFRSESSESDPAIRAFS